jgi:23S rRNA pseudouridine1911/1915/1917 synthase
MSGRVDIEIGPEEAGQRLDRVLAARVPGVSRTRLKDLILSGQVTDAVSEEPFTKPNAKLSAGDVVVVDLPPPEAAEPQPEPIPIVVVYEDAHLIVIDKPAGLVVHPAPGHWTGTLVNALLHHCGDSLSGIGGVRRPGIVHRLDKDTSGLMVVAKSDVAHRGLAEQFADHGRTGALERTYVAFGWGVPDRQTFTVDAPLARDPRNRLKMAVVRAGGKEAVTHVAREAVFGPPGAPIASLLACSLETGRTHQIRVHCAHAGYPLLGDDVYGAGFRTKVAHLSDEARTALAALGRQALHAAVLGFDHPISGRFLRFESELPADLARLHTTLTTL